MDCKCTWREYMLGDGCDQCNPHKALELAAERIDELETELEVIERNDFDQVLQLRGKAAELESRAEAAEAERDKFQKLASHYDGVLREFADALCVEREEDGSPCLGKSPVLWVIKVKERLAAANRLAEELDNLVTQYGCECGHPACNRCRDTRDARAALAAYSQAAKEAE